MSSAAAVEDEEEEGPYSMAALSARLADIRGRFEPGLEEQAAAAKQAKLAAAEATAEAREAAAKAKAGLKSYSLPPSTEASPYKQTTSFEEAKEAALAEVMERVAKATAAAQTESADVVDETVQTSFDAPAWKAQVPEPAWKAQVRRHSEEEAEAAEAAGSQRALAYVRSRGRRRRRDRSVCRHRRRRWPSCRSSLRSWWRKGRRRL